MSPAYSRKAIAEEVVFRTNSDAKSIIFVDPSGNIIYAEEGSYGGYILKPKQLGLDSFNGLTAEQLQQVLTSNYRAFFVELSKQDLCDTLANYQEVDMPEDVKRKLGEVLGKLPEDVWEELKYATVELVTYRYFEVDAKVKKLNSNYAVLDFEPKPNGLKLAARAVRIAKWYTGSRKRPKGHVAPRVLKELQLKHPENEVVQKYMYAKSCYPDFRDSVLYLKIVVEAPEELVPSTVAPTTQQERAQQEQRVPILVNGFLVISRLPSKSLLDTHLPEIFKDTKIGVKQIKLTMGYFYNKLGTLSRKFYNQILPKYAIDAGFGYIVPKSKVADFLREVDMLKREYEEYEKQLKDFLLHGKVPPEVAENKRAKVYKEYLDIVLEYLRKHGKEEEVRKKIESLDITKRIQIRLLPFAVDMRIVEEFVDDKVKKRLEEELASFRKEMANAIRERIKEYMEKLRKNLEKYATSELRKELLERAREDLEKLENEARELGLELPELERLREMLSEERVEELAVETAEGRLKALMTF